MSELDCDRGSRQTRGKPREVIQVCRLRNEIRRELKGQHSKLARFAQRRHRAPKHPERHIDDLLRRSRKLAMAPLLRWQHLAQLFWKPRDLGRMLRHQREWFDIEDEAVWCALGPQPRVTFRWQGVVGRIDFDRV